MIGKFHIVMHKLKKRIAFQMLDICFRAGK